MITKGDWTIEYGFIKEDDVCISNDGFALIAQLHNEDNAEFIVSACNACKSINEEHPELVAQNIKEMYEALIMLYDWAWSGHVSNDEAKETADSVLSKIKGGELK